MNHIQLRPHHWPAGKSQLTDIWFEASRIAHHFLGEQTLTSQRALIEDHYLKLAETWVAWDGAGPLGFISLLDNEVGGLFVHPSAQGRGVGRQLIDHALATRPYLELNVYAANSGAMAFYQRLGFIEQSRSAHDAEGLPFENILMRLDRA